MVVNENPEGERMSGLRHGECARNAREGGDGADEGLRVAEVRDAIGPGGCAALDRPTRNEFYEVKGGDEGCLPGNINGASSQYLSNQGTSVFGGNEGM